MQMEKLLLFSDTYMPFIALIVYLTQWKHIGKKEQPMLVYIIFNLVIYGLSNILWLQKINNLFLYHTGSLVELWVVTYYILSRSGGKNWRIAFYTIGAAYTVFSVLNVLFLEDITLFNSNSAVVASLAILFVCMYYMLNLSKSNDILYFQKLPMFWQVSGFLIYSAVSILVLLSYRYFVSLNMIKDGNNLWYVLDGAIILKFALISIGLLCHRKQRPASPLLFLL